MEMAWSDTRTLRQEDSTDSLLESEQKKMVAYFAKNVALLVERADKL
jgi:hypothetical protein